MAIGDILILGGMAGAVISLILIPVCTVILRKKGKRLSDEIYRDYEK